MKNLRVEKHEIVSKCGRIAVEFGRQTTTDGETVTVLRTWYAEERWYIDGDRTKPAGGELWWGYNSLKTAYKDVLNPLRKRGYDI